MLVAVMCESVVMVVGELDDNGYPVERDEHLFIVQSRATVIVFLLTYKGVMYRYDGLPALPRQASSLGSQVTISRSCFVYMASSRERRCAYWDKNEDSCYQAMSKVYLVTSSVLAGFWDLG